MTFRSLSSPQIGFCVVVLVFTTSLSSFRYTYAEPTDQDATQLADRAVLGTTNASIRPPLGWQKVALSKNALLEFLPPDSTYGASLNAFLNSTSSRDLDKIEKEVISKRSKGTDNWKLVDSERITLDGQEALTMTYTQDVGEGADKKTCYSIGCYIVVDQGVYVLNFNCLESGVESLGPTARLSLLSFSIERE